MRPLVSSLVFSTTFIQRKPRQEGYIRVDNPTRLELESRLAGLEKAKFALAFSSGSMAITSIFLSLEKGDHVICHRESYEGTIRLLNEIFNRLGVEASFIDLKDEDKLKKTIKKNTKLIWFETVTNPTLSQVKIEPIIHIAKENNLLVAVDNTFATPFFSRPLEKGVDIVVHSLTKFINGHNDVLGGAIMTNNRKIFETLQSIQVITGGVLSSFDSFLILRSIKTFFLRMRKHTSNAKKIVHFLKRCPKVQRVSYPGFSGVVSFWLKPRFSPFTFLNSLKHIKIAHSFGGAETTIMSPSLMMKSSLSRGLRSKLGLTRSLFRLSVGLESHKLIIKDLSWLKK